MNNYNKDILHYVSVGVNEYYRAIRWEKKMKEFGITVGLKEFEKFCNKFNIGFIEGDVDDCLDNIMRGRVYVRGEEDSEDYLDFTIYFEEEEIEKMIKVRGQHSIPKLKEYILRYVLECYYVEEDSEYEIDCSSLEEDDETEEEIDDEIEKVESYMEDDDF